MSYGKEKKFVYLCDRCFGGDYLSCAYHGLDHPIKSDLTDTALYICHNCDNDVFSDFLDIVNCIFVDFSWEV